MADPDNPHYKILSTERVNNMDYSVIEQDEQKLYMFSREINGKTFDYSILFKGIYKGLRSGCGKQEAEKRALIAFKKEM